MFCKLKFYSLKTTYKLIIYIIKKKEYKKKEFFNINYCLKKYHL